MKDPFGSFDMRGQIITVVWTGDSRGASQQAPRFEDSELSEYRLGCESVKRFVHHSQVLLRCFIRMIDNLFD